MPPKKQAQKQEPKPVRRDCLYQPLPSSLGPHFAQALFVNANVGVESRCGRRGASPSCDPRRFVQPPVRGSVPGSTSGVIAAVFDPLARLDFGKLELEQGQTGLRLLWSTRRQNQGVHCVS
jgi:hypothetical protein